MRAPQVPPSSAAMRSAPSADGRGELMIRATAMPTDTNPYGGVFGGWLMSQMALGAGALASREEAGKAVVVAASDFVFPGAMALGDELSVYCGIAERGRTSLHIAAQAYGRERHGSGETKVAEGRFRFVMLGGDGKPRALSAGATSDGARSDGAISTSA